MGKTAAQPRSKRESPTEGGAVVTVRAGGVVGKGRRPAASPSPMSSPSTSSFTSEESNSSEDEREMRRSELRRRSRRRARRRSTEHFTSMSPQGIVSVVWHRTAVLVMLLLLQSLSQIILESYEGLISSHVIIPLFLTMLVGAGGNAGNQSTVRSITGLVTGEFSSQDFWRVLRKEVVVGLLNATILATIGFGRVYYFYGHRNLFYSTIAITLSLFCIVSISVILGTILPFALGYVGLNREHAAPIIQVMMDIVGVLITCSICYHVIPDSEHTSNDKSSV